VKINFQSFSEVGPRQSNDDRLLIPVGTTAQSFIVAVADGIGGAAGGGDAASIAIEQTRTHGPRPELLSDIFSKTVDKIKQQATLKPDLSRMGTTLSVAAIADSKIHVAHVGDTRLYHIRGRGLNTLTEDQTEIAELVRKGIFTEGQARRYPRRNVLLSALSAEAEYTVYRSMADLQQGDRLVLTSDGVHQRIMRGGLLNLSLANPNIDSFVDAVRKKVIEAQPSDNFSLLAIDIVEV
jgi:PPM family protein phosphatase